MLNPVNILVIDAAAGLLGLLLLVVLDKWPKLNRLKRHIPQQSIVIAVGIALAGAAYFACSCIAFIAGQMLGAV